MTADKERRFLLFAGICIYGDDLDIKENDMKILITGANGYLGRGIVNAMLDRGMEVIATDLETSRVDGRAVHIPCDLFAIENPYQHFGKPDAVLHLAWRDGFAHYSDAHTEDLPKHYLFIKRMVQAGIRQMAVMGSMHEIGFFEGSIKEDTPCRPNTPYGISKNALRELVQMETRKNGVVFQWLRGYYIVCNTRYGNSVFSKLTAAAEDGQEEFPFTMGQNQYDFIDYKDFCRQTVAAAVQTEVNGIINICSGKPEKLADRVERFIQECGLSICLKYGAFPERPYDSKAVWGDNTKIERILKSQQ